MPVTVFTTTIDDPTATFFTEANGIDNQGIIVGTISNGTGTHGFLRGSGAEAAH
jgi:hypothetical protein